MNRKSKRQQHIAFVYSCEPIYTTHAYKSVMACVSNSEEIWRKYASPSLSNVEVLWEKNYRRKYLQFDEILISLSGAIPRVETLTKDQEALNMKYHV